MVRCNGRLLALLLALPHLAPARALLSRALNSTSADLFMTWPGVLFIETLRLNQPDFVCTATMLAYDVLVTSPSCFDGVDRTADTDFDGADAAFSQTTSAQRIRTTSAQLNSTATQTADGTRIKQFSTEFASIASQLTAAAKVGNTLVNMPVSATLTVSGDVSTGAVIAVSSAFTQSTINDRIRDTDFAGADAVFTATISAQKTFEIQYRVTVTSNTQGLGISSNFSFINILIDFSSQSSI
jgi:hypothetical protein